MEFRTSAAAAFFLARVFLPFMYIYGPRPAAGTAARAADRKKSPRAVASAARGAAAAAAQRLEIWTREPPHSLPHVADAIVTEADGLLEGDGAFIVLTTAPIASSISRDSRTGAPPAT